MNKDTIASMLGQKSIKYTTSSKNDYWVILAIPLGSLKNSQINSEFM